MSAVTAPEWAARRVVKRAYHAARNLPDRLLHRRRYLAALRHLSRMPRPRTILVVCYGNVCRSPYLQAVLQRALPEIVVTSAGFVGSDRPVPELSAAIGARRGFDLASFRSRPLTPMVVTSADLIIVMDAEQGSELVSRFPVTRARILVAGDLDPAFETARGIVDPWGKTAETFEISFDRLDRCAATLIRSLPAST